MSITKLGPQYYRVRVMVKGRRGSENVRGPRTAAKAVEAAMRARLEAEADEHSCPTVSAFWRDFMASCERKGLRPSTVQGYEKEYRNHIAPEFGDVRLDGVTPMMVSAWLGSMSAGAARHAKAVMSAMYSYAEELGIVEHSVMRRRYTLPKERARKACTDVLTWEQMLQIAELAQGEPWEAYFLVMGFAGLRREEAAGLKVEDIYERRGFVCLDVRRTVQWIGGEASVGPCKTAGSERTALMFACGERLLELRDAADVWLTGDADGPANPNVLSAQWSRWFADQPMARVPMKNLRNSFTTAMAARGADTALLSKITGHASMDVTYMHYLRPTADDFIDAFGPSLARNEAGGWPNS